MHTTKAHKSLSVISPLCLFALRVAWLLLIAGFSASAYTHKTHFDVSPLFWQSSSQYISLILYTFLHKVNISGTK